MSDIELAHVANAPAVAHTSPRMEKDQVADILVDIGLLLELKGENPFKTRAYQNSARRGARINGGYGVVTR